MNEGDNSGVLLDQLAAQKEQPTPELQAIRELAQRELCRRKLMPFIQRANPAYIPGWVHYEICKKLEEFEKEIHKAMAEGRTGPRLLITVPPRHGKSEIASRSFPAWYLGKNPSHEIISCSYASSLALKFSRSARTLYKSPMFKSVFPDSGLDPDSTAAENWLTKYSGGYLAAGVGGPITGTGMHCGIVDDPIKNREEAESETIRESIIDWYTSTFYTRLAPGGGIIVIQTRWHEGDLAGWLIDEMKRETGDTFEIINFPAIAEEDEEHRKKGEALHEARYPIKVLEQIRRVIGERDFTSLYQQRPSASEGDQFKRSMLHFYEEKELPPKDQMTFYQAWDFAIGQKQLNDYTVGICGGIDQTDNLWITDVVRGKWDSLRIVDELLDFWELWQAERVGLEHGQIAMALGPLIEKRIAERNMYAFPYVPEDNLKPGRQDKVARSAAIRGRMRQRKVFIPKNAPWVQNFVDELLKFPNGNHDDQVDALSWLGIMMNLFYAPRDESPDDNMPKWLKKLLHGGYKGSGSGGTSAMSA